MAKGGGVGQILIWVTKGVGEVGQMLTLADKGGMGEMDPPIFG